MSQPEVFTLRCPGCGVKNRVPATKLADGPKCGKCGTRLPLEGIRADKPVVITDATFEKEIIQSPLPVLLDCWADWCGPCRMVGPIIEELARQWQGRIKVAKLNVDQNQGTAARFRIQSIPTLLVFDGGRLKETLVGALPKAQIVQKMAPYLQG